MARIKLMPYTLRIKDKSIRSSDSFLDLDNIKLRGNNKNITKIVLDFCAVRNHPFLDDNIKKTLCITKYFTDDNIIYGVMKRGEYGHESDFYDVVKKQRIPKARRIEHAEEIPLFFLFHYPDGPLKDTSFLILQTFGSFAGKTIFERAFNDYISQFNSDLSVKIMPLMSEEIIKKYEQADAITTLRLICKDIPRDSADKFMADKYEDIIFERVYRAKRNKSLPKDIITKLLGKNKKIRGKYFEIAGEHYDSAKVTMKIADTRLTFEITLEESKLREVLPLDDKKLEFEGGHPTINSILPHAEAYLNYILKTYK